LRNTLEQQGVTLGIQLATLMGSGKGILVVRIGDQARD